MRKNFKVPLGSKKKYLKLKSETFAFAARVLGLLLADLKILLRIKERFIQNFRIADRMVLSEIRQSFLQTIRDFL